MRENRIRIEPFLVLNLLSYHGVKRENEHGCVELSGIISREKAEEYLELLHGDTWVTITVADDKENRIIFRGIITRAGISQEGMGCVLTLELKTGTYLMEGKRHIRSFQDGSLSYKGVIKTIIDNYGQSGMIMTASDQTCGFLLQYQETDWSFFKRIASCMNTVLIADSATGGSKFFCGVPQKGIAGQIETSCYQIEKRLDEYAVKKMNGLPDMMEEDAWYYILKLRDIYELGDEIVLNGIAMYICSVYSELVGSELCHTYYLKRKNGFRVIQTYNESLVGVSMTGQVTGVQSTQIKIKLNDDENQMACGERWFGFSTPYSSLGGAGFYCMPEIGDAVRLYFPTMDEKTAYGISSVHREERENPAIKSIMNTEGKQIIMAPDYIRLTNNKGMSIELNDHSGVKVESSGGVSIQAAGSMDIVSKNAGLTLSAKDKVMLKQGETVLNLSGNISLNGAKVNIN